MLTDLLHRVANQRQSLNREEAREVMTEILTGKCTDGQIAGLLVALHMKGETVEEIVGFAEAIRAAAAPFALPSNVAGDTVVDTCGTGGDAICTFNISTTAALVVAGAGVRVAKHGNRSNTPKLGTKGLGANCGAADVMESLGVSLSLSPQALADCLEEVGITFLFAPAVHSAMKYVQPVRRELRLRTVFNLLGPLTNPAHASAQVVGVYSAELVEKVAEALSMLGLRRAMVVHGLDGLDEITITGPTRVAEVRDSTVRSYEVTPEEFGIPRASLETIAGGDAPTNAAVIRQILAGEKSPRRDIVLLNAGAALLVAGQAEHLSDSIQLARTAIDSGAALKKLEALVRFTNSHRQ